LATAVAADEIALVRGLKAPMKDSKRTGKARLFQAKRRAIQETPTGVQPVSAEDTGYKYISPATVAVLRPIVGAEAGPCGLELDKMLGTVCESGAHRDPMMRQGKPVGLTDGLKKILKGLKSLGKLLDSEACELAVRKLHFDDAMSQDVKRPTDEELRAALLDPRTGPSRTLEEVDAIMAHSGSKSIAQIILFRLATHVPLRERLRDAEANIEAELPHLQRPGRGNDLAREFLVHETLKILARHGCPTTKGGFSGPSRCERVLAGVLADAKKHVPDLSVPATMRGLVEEEQKRLQRQSNSSA
jgi:hypothetical protein